MFILTNIHTKKILFFLVWIFSITLTKEVDFNQASPSYEVAMEISKGKEKAKKVLPEASWRLQRNATGPLSLAATLPAG